MDSNDTNIQVIILSNDEVLISQIEEVSADIGEPNCKLTSPYKILCNPDNRSAPITSEPYPDRLVPWLSDLTDDSVVLISSDKILTLVEPHKNLIDLYLKLATA
jgi:hypothetical protein